MGDLADHWLLWLWTGPELVVVTALVGLLAASLVGEPPLFAAELSSIARPVRAAAIAFLVIELLIPAWVFVDRRRRADAMGGLWIHVAAMPVINLFGLVAYLEERRRQRAGRDPPRDDAI